MMSLRIEKEESDKIFLHGYRGQHVDEGEGGSGIGMFVVREALRLNNLTVKHTADYSKSDKYMDNQYILNRFVIARSVDEDEQLT